MTDNGFNLSNSIMSKAPGIGGWDAIYSYPQAMQDELMKQYNKKYTAEDQKRPIKPVSVMLNRKALMNTWSISKTSLRCPWHSTTC